MNLIEIIRDNRLIYLDTIQLAKKLEPFTKMSVEDLKLEINKLIHSGDLFLDENKKVVIFCSKKLT